MLYYLTFKRIKLKNIPYRKIHSIPIINDE